MLGRLRWVMMFVFIASAPLPVRPLAGQTPVAKSPVTAPLAVSTSSEQSTSLDVGSLVSGTLADGDMTWPKERFLDVWSLAGREGSTVTVDLLSDAFDAVLYLIEPFDLRWDDDGAGGCSARLAITFPSTGTYRLIVSTYHSNVGGPYTLRVSNRPAGPVGGPCAMADSATTAPEPPANQTCLDIQWMEWLAIAAEPDGGSDYPALHARELTACELGLEAGRSETWANGQTAFFSGNWYYPNGQTARFFDNWYYPNSQTARFSDNWYYPNGQTARFSDTWYLPNGTRSSIAGIIEWGLARLPQGRGDFILTAYRNSSEPWASLYLVVLASEASRY